MGPDSADRRVRRTQQALRSALLSLIEDKGYDAITIQDILERADVGRSTFYTHYRDKEHLLLSGFDDIRTSLSGHGYALEATPPAGSGLLDPTVVIFEHVERYRYTWKPLVRKGGADFVTRILQDSAETTIREHLRQHFADQVDQARIEAATQFLSSGLMGLLMWWLDSEASHSAKEVHAMFTRLAAPGLRRFLSA